MSNIMRRLPFVTISTMAITAALSPFGVLSASAVGETAKYVAVCGSKNSFFSISPWYACLPGGEQGEPRIEKLNDVFLIIFPVLEGLIKIGAYVAAAMIFYNIVSFITARGNPGKAGTAMTGIRDAVIGFIITLIAFAIVNFIAGAFTPR